MDKYKSGEKICSELFQKTGDIRYHNMMNGFKQLGLENMKEEEQREM